MKRLAVFLFVAASFFSVTFSPERVSAAPPVKIGVILPLSGDSASIGLSIKNGMEMAYEKLAPALKERIKLIYEDDQFNASKAVAAFQKLTTIDKIDLLLTAYSGQSKAIAPLADQKKIPQLAIASDPDIVRGKTYVMNFWVTPDEECRATIEEALRRGYKKIARIAVIQQGFVAIRNAFDTQNKGRLEIQPDDEYNPDILDFRTFLSKVKEQKDLDAVFVLLMVNGQTGTFAKQAREMGVGLPLFNIEAFEDASEQRIAQGALAGHWYVINADPSGEFTNAYQKRYPGASLFAAGNGHDAMLLLAAAIERNAGSEAVNEHLHNVKDFSGVLGTYSATADNRFTLPAAVKIVPAGGGTK